MWATRGERGEARARELTRRLPIGALANSRHPYPAPTPNSPAKRSGSRLHADHAAAPEPATSASTGAAPLPCSLQRLQEPPSRMPAAAPAVSCSRCYAHSATGRATGRGAAAHCQRSGARQSSQASRSTRSPTCGAAGSCSRSARALLRDKKRRQGVRFLLCYAWRRSCRLPGPWQHVRRGSAAHLPIRRDLRVDL